MRARNAHDSHVPCARNMSTGHANRVVFPAPATAGWAPSGGRGSLQPHPWTQPHPLCARGVTSWGTVLPHVSPRMRDSQWPPPCRAICRGDTSMRCISELGCCHEVPLCPDVRSHALRARIRMIWCGSMSRASPCRPLPVCSTAAHWNSFLAGRDCDLWCDPEIGPKPEIYSGPKSGPEMGYGGIRREHIKILRGSIGNSQQRCRK